MAVRSESLIAGGRWQEGALAAERMRRKKVRSKKVPWSSVKDSGADFRKCGMLKRLVSPLLVAGPLLVGCADFIITEHGKREYSDRGRSRAAIMRSGRSHTFAVVAVDRELWRIVYNEDDTWTATLYLMFAGDLPPGQCEVPSECTAAVRIQTPVGGSSWIGAAGELVVDGAGRLTGRLELAVEDGDVRATAILRRVRLERSDEELGEHVPEGFRRESGAVRAWLEAAILDGVAKRGG